MLVEDSEGGYVEERFLYCLSRVLRRSEGEEKASAYFGRNDNVVGARKAAHGNLPYEKRVLEVGSRRFDETEEGLTLAEWARVGHPKALVRLLIGGPTWKWK
jgi:hypothetical protein